MSALCLLSLLAGCASVRGTDRLLTGQHSQAIETEVQFKVGCKYWLYLPKDYNETADAWPLVLFLHGAGERGDDLDLVKKWGPPKLVDEGKDFPFILVSPQCPADAWWSDTAQILALDALLKDVALRFRVDADRVYVTGLSMGGCGTWYLAGEYPDRFAAIMPICGRGEPYVARRLGHVPAWVFHGADDDVVPVMASQQMVDALKASGGDVKFTIYPGTGHNSWSATYANPEVYEWLLSHSRAGRTP